jgi:hypothetical protein
MDGAPSVVILTSLFISKLCAEHKFKMEDKISVPVVHPFIELIPTSSLVISKFS